MKKKLVALLAAAMMVLSTTTVLAAPSATADAVEKVETAATLKENVKGAESAAGKVEIKVVSDEKAIDSVDEAALEIVKGKEGNVKAKVLAMADLSLPADAKFPATIKVAVDGVYSTDSKNTIEALHWNADKAAWEKVTVVAVERGYVTIEVTSLSPIAFVKVIPTADKFGVEFAVLPLVAVAGLAGAVVTGKKANK